MKKRGQLQWDTFIPWLIGIGLLLVVALAYVGIKGGLGDLGESLRNFFRFGR